VIRLNDVDNSIALYYIRSYFTCSQIKYLLDCVSVFVTRQICLGNCQISISNNRYTSMASSDTDYVRRRLEYRRKLSSGVRVEAPTKNNFSLFLPQTTFLPIAYSKQATDVLVDLLKCILITWSFCFKTVVFTGTVFITNAA